MAVVLVFCRSETQLIALALMTAVLSKSILLPISVTVPPLVAVVIAALVSTWIAKEVVPAPSIPVTCTVPLAEVIAAFVPVTRTPRLLPPVPAPPVPSTVTVPVLPAVIWPPEITTTPM